ncbi:M28 family peptidase [Micromonospora sp. NPDC049497]|uniref:M28 family metallopeptidase n=1 Tax=Micromonospora sp. NPDC049497 TaxID=3364273 RepID=UPI00379DE1B2
MTSPVIGPAPAGVGPNVSRMQAIVTRLAGDDFAGRRTGSPGGRAAAHWLAEQLRAAGATVVLDEFAVPGAVREVHATPQLVFVDGDSRSLVFRREFCEHLASADLPRSRTGPLAAVGDLDLAGAWVLEDAWSPERAAAVAAAGAAGLLVPRGTDAAGWMPKMIVGPAAVDLPVLAVRSDIHDQMRGAVGRATVTATMPLHTVDVIGSNVVATFRPPQAGTLAVLLTAHFDGVGDDPDARFPAACDNASGVAASLEAARVLHLTLPTEVGLAVALLDAEETGAHGSGHHARFVEEGTFVINLDGAAQLGDAAHVEAGGPARPLLAALDAAGRQVDVPLKAAVCPATRPRPRPPTASSRTPSTGQPG